MSDDLAAAFDEVMSEGGGEEIGDLLSSNANIHMGDDESPDTGEQFDDSDIVEEENDDDADIVEDDVTDESLDFDSNKNRLVRVTVNGETFSVPLEEVRNGYMRQADYTRKTQQVAADSQTIQWAKEMQQAFQTDPVGSIKYLQEMFGVAGTEVDPYEDVDPEFKPFIQELQQTKLELANLQRQQQQIEQDRLNASVRSELEMVSSKYTDFDPTLVLPIAIENGLSMEKAYKLWKADQYESDSMMKTESLRKAEQAAAQREAARQASRKVSKGSSNMAASAEDGWKKFDSFEDIFAYEVEKNR